MDQVRQRRRERGGGHTSLAGPEQVQGLTGPQAKLPAGRGCTTSQINLNIVRAAHTKTGPLRCVGAALHVGRQVGTSEARIVESRQVAPRANEFVRPSPALDLLLAERQNLKGDHRQVRLHPPDCRLTSKKLKDRIWPILEV